MSLQKQDKDYFELLGYSKTWRNTILILYGSAISLMVISDKVFGSSSIERMIILSIGLCLIVTGFMMFVITLIVDGDLQKKPKVGNN